MTNVTAAEARNQLSELINRAAYGRERIVLTRRGKQLAALVPMEDVELLERLVEELEDRLDVDTAKKRLAGAEGSVSLDELKAELGL
jgi:prevent-host-death family protein